MQSNLSRELIDYFASLLRVPQDRIVTTVNVLDLGADSIMLMEARGWIETRFGARIEIRRFFEDLNTIEALGLFLAEARRDEPAVAAPPPMKSIAPPPLDLDPTDLATADLALMRSQLTLVADVIEAQNRVAATLRRRFVSPKAMSSPAVGEAEDSLRTGQPGGEPTIQTSKADAI